jgi:hypothetical protein
MERPDTLDRGEPARLIPILADSSREARVASIFLATLMAVPPFAKEILGTVGQRVGTRASVQCFTEIRFKNEEATNLRPDGLVVLESRRGRNWSALVEAKIGNAELTSEQVESYLQIAKRNNIQCLITISNQFVARATHSPVKVSKVAVRNVELYHFSWIYIKTVAHLLLFGGNFDSSEQKYILSEFYRFLDHDAAGVSRFDRMNAEWKEVVAKVNTKATLSKTSKEVENTVAAWQQEVRDICLLMTQNVNRPVHLKLSRAHANDPLQRLKDDSEHLAQNYELSCTLEIPDAAAPLEIRANLRERSICVSMALAAPKDKQRAASRINWLLRQLPKTEPQDIYVKCNWPGRTSPTQTSLAEARAKPEALSPENGSAAPVSFEVLLIRDIAGKFSGTKTFIEHLEAAVPDFYSRVGEHLRAYVAPAPRLQSQKQSEDTAAEDVGEEDGLPIAVVPT